MMILNEYKKKNIEVLEKYTGIKTSKKIYESHFNV